jgi:hypothetical protein
MPGAQRKSRMKRHFQALHDRLGNKQQGRMGYLLLWLLGVPIPILFLIYLLRGCS